MNKQLWLQLKFEFRFWVGQYPFLFFPLKGLLGRDTQNLCNPQTEMVIEGFPRSANSFAVWAFRIAQKRDVRLAHHVHVPAQITYAVKRQIPTLVLVREPKDVMVSIKVMYPWVSIRSALYAYELFYKRIYPYIGGFVLATFEEIITDFGLVIRRVNEKFGTDFVEFEHSKENVQEVFNRIEKRAREWRKIRREEFKEGFVAFPSVQKEGKKEEIRKQMDLSSLSSLVKRCEKIYKDILLAREGV